MHKWGCQTPNGEPFNTGDIVDTFGDGFYVIMQGEFNRLPELRRAAPGALIMARFYLPNWYGTVPSAWALEIANVLDQVNTNGDAPHYRNRDLIDCYTWGNEQNLKVESGGQIGSSPGDMIKPGQYEIIRDWNLSFLNAIDATDCANVPRVFPALAMGNSDDQDDGAGVGLEILQPVIERCDYGAIHPYWNADKPLNDEWYGLGRVDKQLPFFAKLPVLVTETGNFAVGRDNADFQYVAAGYKFQGYPQIFGFAYFIWSDPTKSHQANDMSRNPKIALAIRRATKTPRPTEWTPVEPVAPPDPVEPSPDSPEPLPPTPARDSPPQTTPGKLLIGYQVWQWAQVPTVGTYAHLLRDMNQIGATILADKYADSDALQGRFDLAPSGRPDPLAITSIQVMKDRKAWCKDNGFIYIPWDVPRAIPVNGDPFEGAKQEALFHADVCNQVGLQFRISDLEFYPSFFGYSVERNRQYTDFFNSMARRNDAAELYYRTFAENSDTKTILQPDPRQWGTILFQRLVPYLYSIVWQSYAHWFQSLGDTRNHSEILHDSVNKSKWLELPRFGLSLYSDMDTEGDTPPELAQELLNIASDTGAHMVLVYKAPVDPNKHEVIKAMASNTPATIQDSAEVEDLKADIWKAADELRADYRARFVTLRERASSFGYDWMANGLDATRLAIESAELSAKTAIKAPKD